MDTLLKWLAIAVATVVAACLDASIACVFVGHLARSLSWADWWDISFVATGLVTSGIALADLREELD